MRITKRIEDYIYKQVYEKAWATPKIKELKEAADAELNQFRKGWDELRSNAQKEYTQLLKAMNMEHPENFAISCSGAWSVEEDLPITKAYRTEERNITSKVRNIVQDIIVSMEMGGDKDALNKLLEAVNFD